MGESDAEMNLIKGSYPRMNSCIALGSPCLTPVEITRASKRRLRKQTIPLEMRWRFIISLLNCLGSFIVLRTQNRYLRDNEGKAEAISRAKIPLLG
jgi:hypothetical protein